MASLFSQLFDLFSPKPIRVSDPLVFPRPQTPPVQSQAPASASAATLQPLQNWSHPFKDKKSPLLQLTHLANARAGYYPLGRNGMWHGGVHFDSGTAGALEQSSVHCLADGEVVAYRIDEQSPTTTYYIHQLPVKKPFSRNFVLVRHCLQAPKVEGSADTPPSLILYSLYMHLQDWQIYRSDSAIPRPAFWPEGQTFRVKATVTDRHPSHPGTPGLSVRHQMQQGKVLGLLPRGTEVTISGEGPYRKLEGTDGPDDLKGENGSLRGYLSSTYLELIAGSEYRVKASSLHVRSEARAGSTSLKELPKGTEVTVSGDGEFRKLERVNQYVHFDSLEGLHEPVADRIVVLGKPIAIKAGDLIGHIGEYHDWGADYPEKKMHLEVFSAENVDTFIETCQEWATRLPASGKTWLKLAKGTAVVTHQERFSATQPPNLRDASTLSDADLLVPKSLLDGLPAKEKIVIPATPDREACNWYRLEGLLHDADCNVLDGWVREEVGVTPWVNPWAWEGYQTIFNYAAPRHALASFLRAVGRFNEAELDRHGALADISERGEMMQRLYAIIDPDHASKMTADELQAAMRLPAHAQSLSQMIVHSESEWRHIPDKWDALDEVLGHSGSTPYVNWLAEKARIREISWWNEVAPGVGLPEDGHVYHFHPVGVVGWFSKSDSLINVNDFLAQYEIVHKLFAPGTRTLSIKSKENLKEIITAINLHYESSPAEATLYEIAYMLATVRHEAYHYPSQEYFSETPEVGNLAYFNQYDPVLAPTEELRLRARNMGNRLEGDGYKYRGRGCVHLTWKNNYLKFSKLLSYDFVRDPDAAAKFKYSIPIMILGMKKGIFTGKKISSYFGSNANYVAARQVINGLDEAELVASYAEKFESILKKTSNLPSRN